MAKIRVITENLWAAEKEIISIAVKMGVISAKLVAISLLAPTYANNTFGPTVKSICKGASSGAQSIKSTTSSLGNMLANFITKITTVDEGGIFAKMSSWWNDFVNFIKGEDSDESNSTSKIEKSETVNTETSDAKTGTSTETSTSTEASIEISFEGVAEKVIEGEANTENYGYPRNGYNGVQSNCTWYVAQAIATASGGAVTIPDWGNATNWADSAESDGYTVDIEFEPGSILLIDFDNDGIYDHVGFIENVEGSTITWSEEQAIGRRPSKDWSNVTQIGDHLRWQVTADFTDYINSGNAQCIHIDY